MNQGTKGFDLSLISEIPHPLIAFGFSKKIVEGLERGCTVAQMGEIVFEMKDRLDPVKDEDRIFYLDIYLRILMLLPGERVYEETIEEIMDRHNIKYLEEEQ